MKRTDVKSHCPVNFALESFGDPWSLLIVRDIVFWGKHTYSEFLASKEGISTNILASRLVHLEEKGIIEKQPHATDKRKETYVLAERGLDLIPMLLEMCGWGCQCDPESEASRAFVEKVFNDREGMIQLIREVVKEGGSVFYGANSVVAVIGMSRN
jgi:DNA-binding HxlR family transcriptional regulator